MLDGPARRRRLPRLPGLRGRQWSAPERTVLITVLAIVMGSLFVTTYSLALGDPVPHRSDAALVGDASAPARTVDQLERVARASLVFRRYASVPAALQAIDPQRVYAALDLTARRSTLYIAIAAGASVARVLEQISTVDPTVRVVDTHTLLATDPSGLDIFYLMLVTTIIGFFTVCQLRANSGGLSPQRWTAFVVGVALMASLALTLVDGPLPHRLELPVAQTWGILALQLLAAASFASLMSVLIGRWAVLPDLAVLRDPRQQLVRRRGRTAS